MKRIEEKLVLKNSVKKGIQKGLLTIILLLVGMIIIKQNPEQKEIFQKNIYERSFPFMKLKQEYQKYFGNLFSWRKKKDTSSVFHESLAFQKIEPYENGIQVESLEDGIPIIESGVIIYMGEKEKLGFTIMVEQVDGTKTIYGNIESHDWKLYDYVEKGEILGKAKDNRFYLAFQKDGKYLNYEEYL